MPDYVYLLESRLSADQQNALRQIREVAREAGMILFLTGDAVRDLTSGHAVRGLEIAVHGNALKLKKAAGKAGGKVWGEDEASRSLYLCFPGTVRVDVVSTHRTEYPKPGKPVFHWASIQEDLRDRDFTVNAMAISLNEGSFGLLMDPLNGVADIEARVLRLVSNYGFLEHPALLIRATRYKTRLSWDLDERTQTRYQNAREEGVIEHLSAIERSRELEQIGHEDDGLRVLQALETEGWMKELFPAWTVAKADEDKLRALHELAVALQVQGVHPDMSAAQMQLLTAKLSSKDLGALKKLMLRPGFVEEWNSLDAIAAGFAKVLLAKENLKPSASFKLFTSYDPEAVLWLGLTTKSEAVKERYELFLKTWPEARQRIPHALMQEMRITPELPAYASVIHALFLELIDGKLNTPEELRAFLEPHSPPAPPPQVTIKRSRSKRGAEAKIKERSFDDEDEEAIEDEDLDDIGADDEEADLGIVIPKSDLEGELGDDGEEEEAEEPEQEEIVSAKGGKKQDAGRKAAKQTEPEPPAKAAKGAGVKPEVPTAAGKTGKEEKTKTPPKPEAKPAAAKAAPAAKSPVPAKAAPVKAGKAAAAQKPAVKTAAKAAAKPAAKAPAKAGAKAHMKPAAKAAPGKKKAASPHKPVKAAQTAKKPAAKKTVAKVSKKK